MTARLLITAALLHFKDCSTFIYYDFLIHSGRLAEGDQVLEVNGRSLENVTNNE